MPEKRPRNPNSLRIAVIPGDGIGPEVVAEAAKALRAVAAAGHRNLELVQFDWSAERYLRDGTTLPAEAPESLRRDFDAILAGAFGDPRVPSNQHAADILLGLRFKLDLYANVRPCSLIDRRFTPLRDREEKDVQFTVIRENTEGIYIGAGGFFKKGTSDEIAIQEDVNTRRGVERIIRYAFEFARRKSLKRLCMSDKSNAMSFAGGLWQRVFAEVRKDFSDVESGHLFIDTLAAELVRDPTQFQVIVTGNLFGDIISDLGAQLAGGMGLAPSGNINPDGISMFEPVHGSAPKIAGKGMANPMAAILAAGMMLEHLGWNNEGAALARAVRQALREDKLTPELGGKLTTSQVGDSIASAVSRESLMA